jgi:hypothetical protein
MAMQELRMIEDDAADTGVFGVGGDCECKNMDRF